MLEIDFNGNDRCLRLLPVRYPKHQAAAREELCKLKVKDSETRAARMADLKVAGEVYQEQRPDFA